MHVYPVLSGQRQGSSKPFGAECFCCAESRERGADDDDSAALFEACPRSIVMHASIASARQRAQSTGQKTPEPGTLPPNVPALAAQHPVLSRTGAALAGPGRGACVCLVTPSRSSGL